MRFKVPQNVQREDQILGPITLRQLIVLMITGGFSYLMYTQFNKMFYMNQLQQVLIWLPLAIGAAFAFIKIRGIPLFKFCLLMIEQTVFLPRKRFWQTNASSYVSMTQNQNTKKSQKEDKTVTKSYSEQKVKNLAALLDGESPEAHRLD